MPQTAEDSLRLLRRLRQVREYTTQPVSDEILNDILEVGRWSGSGGNRQPTEVVVVKDPELKKKFGEWGAKPASAGAVALLLVTASDDAMVDEGRMAERLMLAANSHGLGAGISTLKNEGPEEVKKLLGIPTEKRARVLIAVGHTDVEARRTLPKSTDPLRKAMSHYAHRGHW